MTMLRRNVLKSLAVASASLPLAAPALAQGAPKVTWKLTSSFPKSLDLIYGAAISLAQRVSDATDGQFVIEVHPPGELASALDALDAVKSGKADLGHTALAYYWGKDPSFAFGTGVPFGMNARLTNSWFYEGGGNEAINEFLTDYGVTALPIGNTGAQMGGWFRREVKTAADFKGLKVRSGGFTGTLFKAMGAVPDATPMADMPAALKSGALDAVEFVSPYDDEKLSISKLAPYYYYPGWWQGSSAQHLVINLAQWNGLPKAYRAIFTAACAAINGQTLALYDARNPAALRRLVASGSNLQGFSADITEAAYKAAEQIFVEAAKNNDKFRKLHENYTAFRNDGYLWWQVCEYTYDNFIIRQRAREAI